MLSYARSSLRLSFPIMVLIETSLLDVEACCPTDCIEAAFLIVRLGTESETERDGIIQFCFSGLGGSSWLRLLIAVWGRTRVLARCLVFVD